VQGYRYGRPMLIDDLCEELGSARAEAEAEAAPRRRRA
jgi:hypothetical protein